MSRLREVTMNISPRFPYCKVFSGQFAMGRIALRRPLIAPLVALFFLAILTGCHLGRTPSPGLSMAAVAVSAGGLLAAQSLISLSARHGGVNFNRIPLAAVRESKGDH
jgi:hypothetical protein